MTNHLQEPSGVEMPQDNIPSSDDMKNTENQPIAMDMADDDNSSPVEDQIPETVDETDCMNIEDEWLEESDFVEKPAVNFSGFTRKEIVERLRGLLERLEIDTIREEIDEMKYQFYRKLKAEEELKRAVYIENGGVEDSYLYEEDEQELVLKTLMLRYRDIRNVISEKQEVEKQKNLEEKLRIIDELKELTNSSESIGETFQQFRDLQNRWRAIGLVPQTKVKNLWDTYHHYVEVFYDYIKINKELRDLDFKRNLEMKIELCEKAEALLLETSVVTAFRTLQTYHDQWREIGPVPKEMRVEIWERFKAISTQVNKKHQDHFEQLKETHKKNKDAKEALCARVEEILQQPIPSPSEWRKNTQEIVEMQKLWNTIGHTGKKDNRKLYKRFHTLCDKFFNQKREFTGLEREKQENNLQLKQDICVQAEALKDSTEWRATTDEIIQLQNKWKEIGNVPSKHHEAIWKRFRSACDYFFEQKAKYYSSIESEYDINLRTKRELIMQIRNFKHSDNPEESFEQLKEFQRQWSAIGHVPHRYMKKVQDDYRRAISKQFDALRMDDSERDRLQFRNRIETMASSPQSRVKLAFERNKMMYRFQELQNDLVVWENNIGFFSKSKKTEALVANVQNMIEQGKVEMKELEQKIKLIDSLENK